MLILGDAAMLVACTFDRRVDTVVVDLNPFTDWIDPDIGILGICVPGVRDGLRENREIRTELRGLRNLSLSRIEAAAAERWLARHAVGIVHRPIGLAVRILAIPGDTNCRNGKPICCRVHCVAVRTRLSVQSWVTILHAIPDRCPQPGMLPVVGGRILKVTGAQVAVIPC